MFSQKYEPVCQAATGFSKEDSHEQEEASRSMEQRRAAKTSRRFIYLLLIVLGLSIASNVLLLTKLRFAQDHGHDPSFAGLERNVGVDIPHDDRTIDDPMWDSPTFDWNLGWVALDNGLTQAEGLPTAMRWPWDESKSIYVLHGFHSIHCVFVLRDSIMQYRDGKKQVWPFGHVTHCLHVLREDTTCNADDTPRYTGHLHAQENSTSFFSGIGQTRQCRDWNQLRDFAIENSACYRRPLHQYVPLIDRYKNCPDGSKPWEDSELV